MTDGHGQKEEEGERREKEKKEPYKAPNLVNLGELDRVSSQVLILKTRKTQEASPSSDPTKVRRKGNSMNGCFVTGKIDWILIPLSLARAASIYDYLD